MTDNLELLHDRYAKALFEMAKEKNEIDEAMQEIDFLNEEYFADEDFRKFLSNPLITAEEKGRVLDELTIEKVLSKTITNFLKVLIKNKRPDILHGVFIRYRDLYDAQKGLLWIGVETAIELSERQKEDLSASLRKIFQKKLKLKYNSNPLLLGGIRLNFDGKIYDSSVLGKLESLEGILS